VRRRESSLKWFAGFLFLCLTSHWSWVRRVKLPEEEQKQKRSSSPKSRSRLLSRRIRIRGNTAFDDKTLRSQLKEQLTFTCANGPDECESR
jgi:hypothetical protein